MFRLLEAIIRLWLKIIKYIINFSKSKPEDGFE